MITDSIIDILLSPFLLILDSVELPFVDELEIPENVFDTLLSFVRPVGYILPTRLIISCLAFSFALDHFNIIWAFICKFKSLTSVRL